MKSMLRRALRLLLLAAMGLAASVALGACAVFVEPPSASQIGTIGPVKIHFKVCASQYVGTPPSGSCTSGGNSSSYAAGLESQLFVGFRVPSGASGPASFSSTATGPADGGPTVEFTRNAGYTSELQRLNPAPSGQEWQGYVTQTLKYSNTEGEQNFEASPEFTPPAGAGGAPFAGPFIYRVIVGGRQYSNSNVEDEAIDCGSSLTEGYEFNSEHGFGRVVCADAPEPGEATPEAGSEGQLDSDMSLAVNDASVVGGTSVSAATGATASASFSFDYAGAALSEAFALTATTNVPGAAATPSVASITPSGDGSTPVQVSVPVPASADSGSYTVTLKATLPDGEVRSASVPLVVSRPIVCMEAVSAGSSQCGGPAPCKVSGGCCGPATCPHPTSHCVVPHLQAKTVGQAQKLLRKDDCRLGPVTRRHSKIKRGRVISQSRHAGAKLSADSKVSLVVSSGPQKHETRHSHRK